MRKLLFGTFAFAVMTLLAHSQEKLGQDQPITEKPGTQKPASSPPSKDQPGAKPGLTEKDKSSPQKGGVPPAGTGKVDPPKAETLKKELPKSQPVKDVSGLADWEKLKGEWVSTNFEYDGQHYPADGRWSLIFEKQKEQEMIRVTGNPPTTVFWTGPVRLDSTASPSEITLVQPALIGERLQRGIYLLIGDYLIIGWSTGFDAARPKDFVAKADSNLLVATWVRKKPPAAK